MSAWPEFNNNGTVYDLSHLHPKTMKITREATDSHPSKDVRIFLSYSDHCFTDHYGEDDSWIYTNAQGYKTRYFCRERYEYSFEIDNILKRVFRDNVYITRTMNLNQYKLGEENAFHYVTQWVRDKDSYSQLYASGNPCFANSTLDWFLVPANI